MTAVVLSSSIIVCSSCCICGGAVVGVFVSVYCDVSNATSFPATAGLRRKAHLLPLELVNDTPKRKGKATSYTN